MINVISKILKWIRKHPIWLSIILCVMLTVIYSNMNNLTTEDALRYFITWLAIILVITASILNKKIKRNKKIKKHKNGLIMKQNK